MRLRLDSILTTRDLPLAELHSAKLDGELFDIDGAFVSIDQIEGPHHRAHAVHYGLSPRLIAEQSTACWVWGVLPELARPLQFCVASDARIVRASTPLLLVREVIIGLSEIASFGSAQVTDPTRTVIDLARFSDSFDGRERDAVRALVAEFAVDLDGCLETLASRRNLTGKRRAIDRLSRY